MLGDTFFWTKRNGVRNCSNFEIGEEEVINKIIWADKDSILVVGNMSGQLDGKVIILPTFGS